MGGLSLPHLIIMMVIFAVIGYPVARILGRLGFSKVLVILAFIPLVNWIALWVLAFARWPQLPDDSTTQSFD